jgi:hypothetical protein
MSSGGREVALVRQSLEDFREFTESKLGVLRNSTDGGRG